MEGDPVATPTRDEGMESCEDVEGDPVATPTRDEGMESCQDEDDPVATPAHDEGMESSEDEDDHFIVAPDKEAIDDTIVTNEGKRKRKEDAELIREKRFAVEGHMEMPIPKKKVICPPSTKEKIKLKKGDWIEFEENGVELRASVIDREKVTGKYYNYFNVTGEDGIKRNIDGERVRFRKLEEEECDMVMIPADRHKDQDCVEARKVELKKLEGFNSYEVVNDEGQYRISCTWIHWYKGEEVRARLVARGYEELEEVRSDSPTVDKCNMRLLLAICQSEGWTLKTSDVKSAFLQGQNLDRDVVIKPPRDAGVPKGKLWKLKVALYGLNDASLQFYIKCRGVLIQLGCVQASMDPAFFYKRNKERKLIGCICLHVDDFLHCGTTEFETSVTDELSKIFMMGKTESKKFRYVGFNLDQQEEGIKVDQSDFAAGLEVFDIKPERAKQVDEDLTLDEKSQLRKVAGKVGWLGRGSRPDLVFAQVEMSTKFINGKVKDLNQAAKVLRKVKNSASFFMVRDLGPVEDWTVEVSTDASLGNLNEGVNSTGAMVVLIVNEKTDICTPMSWHSNKINRIVDSSLAAECLSLKEGLNEAIYIRQMIEEVYGFKDKTVPVRGIVDNKGTVDAIHSTSSVSDRKLRRDVGSIKQMMCEGDVTAVTWCPGREQLSDCMTKRGAPAWNLMEVFQSGNRKPS